MSVGSISSTSSVAQMLMASQQQSANQQQVARTNGASKDGDGDHGVEPSGKGQHINVLA